jgi:hypothetical protein
VVPDGPQGAAVESSRLKWGVVHAADCTNGAGADNTCGTFQLGADSG